MIVGPGRQHAAPARGASFWTLRGEPKRIDHAFVSAQLKVREARYVAQLGKHIFAGKMGSMSDHAALVVDIAAKRRR